jgi:hypothetical protein
VISPLGPGRVAIDRERVRTSTACFGCPPPAAPAAMCSTTSIALRWAPRSHGLSSPLNRHRPQVSRGNFGAIDGQHLVFIFGTGTNAPMTVESVQVWQASAANNLTQ